MRIKYLDLFIIIIVDIIQIFGGDTEHVHLKIYVPEIVNRNIHTKTVYIHVHVPGKKRKKPEPAKGHLETYHENWNSWNAYNQGNYQSGEKGAKAHKNYINHIMTAINDFNNLNNNNVNQEHNQPVDKDPRIPFYDDYRGDSGSMENTPEPPNALLHSKLKFQTGVTGYSYPPQYETHEDVDDIPPNDIGSYEHVNYNQVGHREGHNIQKGHLYTDKNNHFYDDKLEESGEQSIDASNESYGFVGNNYVTKMLAG